MHTHIRVSFETTTLAHQHFPYIHTHARTHVANTRVTHFTCEMCAVESIAQVESRLEIVEGKIDRYVCISLACPLCLCVIFRLPSSLYVFLGVCIY